MEIVLEYVFKSAGVLSIFVLVYHFLLRRLTFFLKQTGGFCG